MGIKSQKTQVFTLHSRHFWDQSEIRYFGKSNLYLLSFSWKILSMSKLGDIQGLNVHPTPISATVPKFSGSPKDMVLLNQHMITRILFMDFTMIR